MNRIRQSFDGIKSMVTNVISFVAGQNEQDQSNDSSLSSGEIVECDSDCSECCSHPQSKSSSLLRQSSLSQ
jgi:ssRNA-specific RNase YbeY (16S rRNA maturation enzyme)